jgi:hypothetical protein
LCLCLMPKHQHGRILHPCRCHAAHKAMCCRSPPHHQTPAWL